MYTDVNDPGTFLNESVEFLYPSKTTYTKHGPSDRKPFPDLTSEVNFLMALLKTVFSFFVSPNSFPQQHCRCSTGWYIAKITQFSSALHTDCLEDIEATFCRAKQHTRKLAVPMYFFNILLALKLDGINKNLILPTQNIFFEKL